MPEGPECRRFVQDLSQCIAGATLVDINILGGRYLKKPIEGWVEFKDSLPQKVVGPGVHGKFIYWILKEEWSIWFTLGMTGAWSQEKSSHSRIEFKFGDINIFFNDQRNFGTVKLINDKQQLIDKLNSLGPDMLSGNVSNATFIDRVRIKNGKTIVEALMDQKVIAGVGNYIKAESLYMAKISPHRIVDDISDEELSRLNHYIKNIMQESFRSGGATIQTYKNFTGEKGEYGSRFIVYNKHQDPSGNKVIREETKDKRSTWWVPDIQN